MKNKVTEALEKPENEKDGKEDEEKPGSSEDQTEDWHSSNTNRDQDSDISFMNDTDEEIDTAVIEEEDWIEYMKNKKSKICIKKLTEEWNGDWRWESHRFRLKDGQWKQLNGTLNSVQHTKPKEP